MTQSTTSDNLKALFAYPFQDTNWINKFLIGSLVVLAGYIIPLIPFIVVYGYMAQIMRRIIVERGEPYLPEWDDWGKMMMDGLKLLGALLIYALPIFVLLCVAYLFLFFGIGLSASLEGSGDAPSGLAAVGSLVGSLGFFCIFGVVMIFALAVSLVSPVMLGHIIATDEFSAAFRFSEWWSIFRANLGGFFIAYVIILAISSAFSFALTLIYLTVILCCLLPVIMGPATYYMLLIAAAVFGQAYRDGVDKLQNV
jgi:hypothetical protein